MNKVFAFEEKLGIYHVKIQNRWLQHFSTMIKTTEDHINISEEICFAISNYIIALMNMFKKKVPDLEK